MCSVRMLQQWVVAVVSVLVLSGIGVAQTDSGQGPGAKQLWQLLDYVAVDYGGAVKDGAVISEGEYAEMLDFTQNAARQIQQLPAHPGKAAIAEMIDTLGKAVVDKADGAQVADLAHQANALLIKAYPIPVAPASVPDLAVGGKLYASLCASCHGASGNGDGPLAAGLDPEPIAFTDEGRARSRSVMALYQVITQGVEGTSMASFVGLPEDERWALAFYVGGLANDTAMRNRGKTLWEENASIRAHYPDLAALTTLTEVAAAQSMSADDARDVTAYLRSEPQAVEADKTMGVALSRLRLAESLAALRDGDRSAATRLALSAYLDGFEPLEPKVGAKNKALLTAVEDGMLAYRAAVGNGSVEQAEAQARRLDELFAQVDAELGTSVAEPMTTFLGALTILLREGLEALLIVIGIIAFLRKADRGAALRHVHAGWISALVAGGLTWAAATYVVSISGASREVTEGLGSVTAAVVLLCVGLWMHQKSSAGRWHAYLSEKVSAAMTRRSAWALFALAFIAVYREVFETVLFFSALAADGNSGALLVGFLVAVALLVVIAWVLLRTSARMPIGKFFSITSVLVGLLAIVLIGKGVGGLQEAGWIGATPVAAPRIDILGIYPTTQTLAAQLCMLVIVLGGFGWNYLRGRARKHPQ